MPEPKPSQSSPQPTPSPSPSPVPAKKPRPLLWIAGIGAVVVLLIGGIAAGLFIGQSIHRPSMPGEAMGRTRPGQNGRPGPQDDRARDTMPGRSVSGTVTAMSTSSITLRNERFGGSVTFQINDDTTVKDGQDDASIEDVSNGDTVRVKGTSESGDTTADTIMLNPQTGNGPED